jgi:hypothetical protein
MRRIIAMHIASIGIDLGKTSFHLRLHKLAPSGPSPSANDHQLSADD